MLPLSFCMPCYSSLLTVVPAYNRACITYSSNARAEAMLPSQQVQKGFSLREPGDTQHEGCLPVMSPLA